MRKRRFVVVSILLLLFRNPLIVDGLALFRMFCIDEYLYSIFLPSGVFGIDRCILPWKIVYKFIVDLSSCSSDQYPSNSSFY